MLLFRFGQSATIGFAKAPRLRFGLVFLAMRRIATSIVLIVGQLAMLCAAPMYICTSADGSQRIEWGDCHCAESHSDDITQTHSPAIDGCTPEHRLAEPPCHCEHQPLTEGTQLVSRSEHVARGILLISFADARIWQASAAHAAPAIVEIAAPLGHTPLVDRLSICLRC